jgi:class 3 adenylate cyclase
LFVAATKQFLNVESCKAYYVGPNDLHDPAYEHTKRRIPFYLYTDESINEVPLHWAYSISIYATAEFEAKYKTGTPMRAAIIVGCSFASIILTLLGYHFYIRQRDRKMSVAAAVSGGIVSSLFPAPVRDHVLDSGVGPATWANYADASRRQSEGSYWSNLRPIASFFPEATVLYADIAGFTSWSSKRPPDQVFILLESIFRMFDRFACSGGVYKVETIGDCYVAVTGLPDPQPNHAEVMATFCIECLRSLVSLTGKLSDRLGDDTLNLSMRFGLNSGPVTAGVLRGMRARFQLFGETVNLAAHMEHTGLPGRIHVSSETARHLYACGKGSWLVPRLDAVPAVGNNGLSVDTFWVQPDDSTESEFVEFGSQWSQSER